MLEEAADKLDGIESENSRSLAVRLTVANEHGAVLEGNDARVGDGDFEDVRSEVFQSRFTRVNGLGVDVPVDLPERGGKLIKQFSLFDQVTELGSEDFRQSLYGEGEIDSRGVPGAIG